MKFAYTVMASSRAGLATTGFETLRWAAKLDRLDPITECLPRSLGTISASAHGWGRQTVREQAARHWKIAEAFRPPMTPVRLREVPCRSKEIELGGHHGKASMLSRNWSYRAASRTWTNSLRAQMISSSCSMPIAGPVAWWGALSTESLSPVCDAVNVQRQTWCLFVRKAAHRGLDGTAPGQGTKTGLDH